MKSPLVHSLASLLSLVVFCMPLTAETVKDREASVRGDRAKMEHDSRWIYNDIDRGFAEAKKTGKPLLVVLRCVPCLACMGIDASILNSDDLQPVLDQFVCVRVINANALDLSLFQFDYDLSFSTMFFNADRTVYGRYGSWKHQRDSQDATTAGYKAALKAGGGDSSRLSGQQAITGREARRASCLQGACGDSCPGRQIRTGAELGWEGGAKLRALPSDRRCLPNVISR
jgi:hypothetical protein